MQGLLPSQSGSGTEPDPVSTADLRDALMRALRALPPQQRAVVVLRYWEQLTQAETAALLGCSEGAVKSAASRGLSRCRETGVRLDAAVVLDGAARAALNTPSPQDNQFLYTDVRAVNPTHSKAWSYRQQTWDSVDGRRPGAIRNTTCFPGLLARDNLPTCLSKIPTGIGG